MQVFLSFFEKLLIFASVMAKNLLICVSILLLSACGGKGSFHISVDVPAVGTQEMTVVYAVEGGERVVLRRPALEGKFDFTGNSADTTTVEIYNARKQLFASFPAADGMELELKSAGDSLYIQDSAFRVVTSIADTVVTSWPEFRELELVIQHDSVASFPPEGIWFFTSSGMEREPALMDSIRKYAKIDTLNVRDVYVSADLGQWRMIANRDSATWTQGLLPDAPIVLQGILNSTPCMVEVDTAGTVIRVQRFE